MSWFAAPLALVLAVTVTDTPLPRLTHAEGRRHRKCRRRPDRWRARGNRAARRLHRPRRYDHRCQLSNDASLRLDDGRVVVRTRGAVDVDSPGARIEIEPHSVAIILVDRAGGRLLVSVPAGALALRTRYASITRVVAGQSAMMPSATSVPWATAYTRVQIDAFTLWSDARAASTGAGVAAGDWVASDSDRQSPRAPRRRAPAIPHGPRRAGYCPRRRHRATVPERRTRRRPTRQTTPRISLPNCRPSRPVHTGCGARRLVRCRTRHPSPGTKPAPTPAARPAAPPVRGNGGARPGARKASVPMTVVVRFARHAGIAALFVAAALGGTLTGVLFAYADDLPQISRAGQLHAQHHHARARARRRTGRRLRGRASRGRATTTRFRSRCATPSSPPKTPASSTTPGSASRA